MSRLTEQDGEDLGDFARDLHGTVARLIRDREVAAARRVLDAVREVHDAWPVLVEHPPEFEGGIVGDPESVTLRMSQRLAWVTQQEYRKRFGIEPPTAPALAAARAVVAAIEAGED
ncbi:MAG TPA: hypothetical protein VFJ14_06805 [Nocardioidaceae bacterium]|nr:hypothetical protein [Nocardioidaceae bacterium]